VTVFTQGALRVARKQLRDRQHTLAFYRRIYGPAGEYNVIVNRAERAVCRALDYVWELQEWDRKYGLTINKGPDPRMIL
jgi:hypothetical protein